MSQEEFDERLRALTAEFIRLMESLDRKFEQIENFHRVYGPLNEN
jgi:hypothetical protein